MKLSPANARKLASLSALGAGALVASMGEAEASVVYTNLAPGAKVGFSSFFASSFGTAKSSYGSAGFRFNATGSFPHHTGTGTRRTIKFSGLNGVKFANSGNMLRLFAAGATLGAAGVAGIGTVAWRSWWRYYHSGKSGYLTGTINSTTHRTGTVLPYTTTGYSASPAGFSNRYALFKFSIGLQTDYGWVKLSLNNVDTYGSANGTGPDLTVLGWAFDNTGVQLPAGDTGVPEPGTFAMTGLAALALGAVGVRRWRAARPGRTA